MRRDQLEHAIRTACQIIGEPEVIVVGSQSILASISEDALPQIATMSMEVDILPMADSNEETARLADLIEGVAGELSPFEDLHGYSIDGVDLETSALPELARPTREGAEREHCGTRRRAGLHRLVPGGGVLQRAERPRVMHEAPETVPDDDLH